MTCLQRAGPVRPGRPFDASGGPDWRTWGSTLTHPGDAAGHPTYRLSCRALFDAWSWPSRRYAASAALLEAYAIPADLVPSQPTVSHRLTQVREAGPLISRRRGTWVHHRLAP